jgi:hypothetical protein
MIRSLRSLFVLLAPLALAGCFSRGAVWADRIEPGPPIAEPGPDAYRVWHDGAGWHLRVSADVVRHFHGSIHGGDTGQVKRIDVPEDGVYSRDGSLYFSFLANEEAGFDWRGEGCVDLALFIDADARAARVHLGAFGASPTHVPETVCP